ncbi:MAG: ankyrin repeat domain-containing protein, partial [Planctomycetes bacterium]|nr:ankyrin repeat domain-containing protein [Planctomycetota bacterium]
MPLRTLPSRPHLTQLKLQAQELARAFRAGKRSAASRALAQLPRPKRPKPDAVQRLSVSQSQQVIAREYGFRDWARLKHHVELTERVAKLKPHPRFAQAVAALDAGDLPKLKRMLEADPVLVQARGNLEPPYGYFTAATLLHHVAGNPNRGPLPKNIVAIAQLLLETGADPEAATLGPNGGSTMGLLVTSKQASDMGVTGPLMDLLVKHGASLKVSGPEVLRQALANHAPRAAERMLELGAQADLIAAAALGRMELLRDCFDDEGRLKQCPLHQGKPLSARDAIGLALLFAYVRGQKAAVDFLLEKDGNWEMIGVNNGAAMHRAAVEGDLAMVQRLAARGASVTNRENPFRATPYSWANHGKQEAVSAWMREHCSIDLHDAAGFDLLEIAKARLREDPARVNLRIDQWDLPQGAPLHYAVKYKHTHMAELLLENGADPNLLAGDGQSPLDLAEADDAKDAAALLMQ